ncbi:MAG TPA: hypothetical protein VIS56_02475 [Candidatus Saccharimonadales bacterium]
MMFNSPLTHFAAGTCAEQSFFDFPTWYTYLLKADLMAVNSDTGRCDFVSGFEVQDLSLIALALVDIALRIAALVTVIYVVYGGVEFITAQGEADKAKKARQTIINALIGLSIALVSVGVVTFIGTRIG